MTATNMNLFEFPEQKTKKKVKYVKSKSTNGELTVHIEAETAKRVKRYCKAKNINCKEFINELLQEKMQELNATKYDGMTREELLDLVKRMERDDDRY